MCLDQADGDREVNQDSGLMDRNGGVCGGVCCSPEPGVAGYSAEYRIWNPRGQDPGCHSYSAVDYIACLYGRCFRVRWQRGQVVEPRKGSDIGVADVPGL